MIRIPSNDSFIQLNDTPDYTEITPITDGNQRAMVERKLESWTGLDRCQMDHHHEA